MEQETKIIHQDQIKLNVGMGGKVGWEIRCYGNPEDEKTTMDRTERIHNELTKRFSGGIA